MMLAVRPTAWVGPTRAVGLSVEDPHNFSLPPDVKIPYFSLVLK